MGLCPDSVAVPFLARYLHCICSTVDLLTPIKFKNRAGIFRKHKYRIRTNESRFPWVLSATVSQTFRGSGCQCLAAARGKITVAPHEPAQPLYSSRNGPALALQARDDVHRTPVPTLPTPIPSRHFSLAGISHDKPPPPPPSPSPIPVPPPCLRASPCVASSRLHCPLRPAQPREHVSANMPHSTPT